MDRLWTYAIILPLWNQIGLSSTMNCTYGEVGSMTVTCVNATTDSFKNTTYKFDKLSETLRCDNCSLQMLNKETFNISRNRIVNLDLRNSSINQIQPEAFVGLNFLEKIILVDNNITKVLPGTFKGLKKLRVIFLQNNTISTLINDSFVNITGLKKLNLNRNSIKTIENRAFLGLKNLVELDLSINNITQVKGVFNGLPSLQLLNLSYNAINILHEDDFSNLPSLLRLIIRHNQITAFPPNGLSDMSALTSLDLSYNSINVTVIDSFRNMKSLEHLDLSHNRFKDIPKKTFQCLYSLRDLDISYNNLSVFRTSVYGSGLPELKSLNLSHCQINSIEINGLFPMSSLQILDLSSNNISNFEYESVITKAHKLSYLVLMNNPLSCDLEDDFEKYLQEDSLKLLLFDKTINGTHCINKTREVTETNETVAPIPEILKNASLEEHPGVKQNTKKNNTTPPTVQPQVSKATKNKEKENSFSPVTTEQPKVVKIPEVKSTTSEKPLEEKTHDVNEVVSYYNSKPAVIWLSILLSILIISVALLTYSHCSVRRIVKQYALARTPSRIMLCASQADADDFYTTSL